MTPEPKSPHALFNEIDVSDPPEALNHGRRAQREMSAHQMRATGLSARRIAAALNVPQGLVEKWLAEAPVVPEPVPQTEPQHASEAVPVEAEALVALRTQFRAFSAQIRGLANHIDRIEARERRRLTALESEVRKLKAQIEKNAAPLPSEAESVVAPAPAARSRLAFWRGRGG